jgi:hypothetical protein
MRIFLTESRTACTEDTTLFENHTYPQRVHLFPETYNRVKTGLINPAHQVAEKVLDPALLKRLRETQTGKTAFILASGNSNFANEGAKLNRENEWTYNYKVLPLSLTQIYAGRVAAQCGEIDHTATDATACTSSLKVLMDVQTLIKFYGFDRVIVLAVEDQVNNMTLQFFGEAKATLTESMAETHQVVPSAFDSKNFGFYIGQGAALAGGGHGFLLVAGWDATLVGLYPNLQKMGFFTFSMVELAVLDAGTCAHALHVARGNAFDIAHAVLVGQIARQHIADDFHVLVAMCAKTGTCSDTIFVDHTQITPAHVRRVVVTGE